MSTFAVIAEYDPFHNGHAWQLEAIKKAHPGDTLLVVLGDVFTERGTPALFSPYLRAEAALRCGADGVVLLPAPYSCMGASLFGAAGVAIAHGIGADTLVFGAECTDRDRLLRVATHLEEDAFCRRLDELSAQHDALSYAKKREIAYGECFGEEDVPLLREPNCLLAFAYLRALKQYGMDFAVLPRVGVSHDAVQEAGHFASASRLRQRIRQGEDISPFCPAACLSLYESAAKAGELAADEKGASFVLGLLSRLRPEEIEGYCDVPHGMGARLHRAAGGCDSLAAFYRAAATKKYSDARIRRMVLAVLGEVPPDILRETPGYTLLLGADERGCAHFRRMAKEGGIPVLTKPAAGNALPEPVREQFLRRERFARLYRLFQLTPSRPPEKPLILKF